MHGETLQLCFPVCYGRPSDVFAASSGFVHLYTLRFKEERTVVTCYVARPTAQTVTVSSLWCDGQIPTAHRTSP